MRFVVAHYTRGVGTPGPHETKQYLEVINHNPYNKPRAELQTLYCEYREDAFIFQSRSAAEFAAVFIGGTVEELPE